MRHGNLCDPSVLRPTVGDVAIRHDTIAALQEHTASPECQEIDASWCAFSAGLITMLGRTDVSLLADGRSQGVTPAVLGEGMRVR